MDLRALRYFVETVRQQSFTRAADTLCVTQSAVSKLVRQLELELGTELLHRQGRGLSLTDTGRLVYERGQEALGVMARLDRDLAELAGLQKGELVIGLPPMVNVFFPGWLRSFGQQHPGLKLKLIEAGGQVIESQVLQGELEVGVTLLPLAPERGLAHAVVARHPICLVGTGDVRWAKAARPELRHLGGQPVLMPPQDYSLNRVLEQAFARAGVQPEVVARSSQWDFLLNLALSGLGTALLPEPLVASLKLPAGTHVKALPATAPAWEVALVWHPQRSLSHAARAWLKHCGVDVASPPGLIAS